MNYYFDTEFLGEKQDKKFLGIKYGETKPTIDLISIGIVDEDDREYYAISKDFNLKEAWNRFQIEDNLPDSLAFGKHKAYWIRDNVLWPIFVELTFREFLSEGNGNIWKLFVNDPAIYDIEKWEKTSIKFSYTFSKSELKRLIKKYGKTNDQIAKEIKSFCSIRKITLDKPATKPVFYAYYADYDWVVFCWLFGDMMSLPDGFPMYCIDLKQIFDEKADKFLTDNLKEPIVSSDWHKNYAVDNLKSEKNYPTQENEHNALDDAKWNKKLHEFIKSI